VSVTFFGTYNTATTPRVQVLIDGLRAHNIAVVECNVPLNISTKQRVSILAQPWKLPLLFVAIVSCWVKLTLRRRHMPRTQAVVIGYMGHFDIHLARRLFYHQPLILDYMISASDTARDRGVNGGVKLKLLTWIDNAALRAADTVLVDTEEHRARMPVRYRSKAIVVAVGAPDKWFKYPYVPVTSGRPLKVIFFGKYTPLQGAPVIGEALGRLRESVSVTMVGSGQDEAATKLAAQVPESSAAIEWIDWVEASKLPKLVASHDVCLGIFGTGPKARRVVPNKIYQGAAAGCALITSDTPPQKRTLEDAALFVPPGDAKALARILTRLATNRNEVNRLKRIALGRAQESFTPQAVVMPLLEKLTSSS
jgi:glycosyltransferase involved in cell wall biosynthesis